MMRRASILGFCLTLAAMAPLPLSACAVLANLPAECQPEPDCAAMGMKEAAVEVAAAASDSCCQISGAADQTAKKEPLPRTATGPLEEAPANETRIEFEVAVVSVPEVLATSPPQQSLLCVFLI
jgi:hypothetical protein